MLLPTTEGWRAADSGWESNGRLEERWMDASLHLSPFADHPLIQDTNHPSQEAGLDRTLSRSVRMWNAIQECLGPVGWLVGDPPAAPPSIPGAQPYHLVMAGNGRGGGETSGGELRGKMLPPPQGMPVSRRSTPSSSSSPEASSAAPDRGKAIRGGQEKRISREEKEEEDDDIFAQVGLTVRQQQQQQQQPRAQPRHSHQRHRNSDISLPPTAGQGPRKNHSSTPRLMMGKESITSASIIADAWGGQDLNLVSSTAPGGGQSRKQRNNRGTSETRAGRKARSSLLQDTSQETRNAADEDDDDPFQADILGDDFEWID